MRRSMFSRSTKTASPSMRAKVSQVEKDFDKELAAMKEVLQTRKSYQELQIGLRNAYLKIQHSTVVDAY